MLNTVVAKHDIKQMSFIGISASHGLFYSLPKFSALAMIFVLCNSKKAYKLVSQMICLCCTHEYSGLAFNNCGCVDKSGWPGSSSVVQPLTLSVLGLECNLNVQVP